jgi:redox-sensing transcriptional repressor
MFSQATLPVVSKVSLSSRAEKRISESTVRRLSLYLRVLQEATALGLETISSEELAKRGGTTSAQVRKDLSLFGSFGKRGLGYAVAELLDAIREILGLDREWNVALVGAGKIGSALFSYRDFQRRGFHIGVVFDADPTKVGRTWGELVIQPDEQMEQVLRERRVDIVIIAVPADVAQSVVDRVVGAGVRAILNFAPVKLKTPESVALRNVDMALELEGLSFALRTAST